TADVQIAGHVGKATARDSRSQIAEPAQFFKAMPGAQNFRLCSRMRRPGFLDLRARAERTTQYLSYTSGGSLGIHPELGAVLPAHEDSVVSTSSTAINRALPTPGSRVRGSAVSTAWRSTD